MMSRDTIFSPVKEKWAATGRKTAHCTKRRIKEAVRAGLIRPQAALTSKPAPSAIKASGVAMTDRLDIVFVTRNGSLIWETEASRPNRIPKIIGFVAIPLRDLTSPFLSSLCSPGPVKDRIRTARIL